MLFLFLLHLIFEDENLAFLREFNLKLQKVYESAARIETTCFDWFRRFKDVVRVKEGQKLAQTLNWRRCSKRIR